jgi:hypothetical protein
MRSLCCGDVRANTTPYIVAEQTVTIVIRINLSLSLSLSLSLHLKHKQTSPIIISKMLNSTIR